MELLTTEELKTYLKISSNTTIYKLIQLKAFPKIKIGNKYKIPKDLLDKWITANINKDIVL